MILANTKCRILYYIEIKGITKPVFYEKTGIKRGLLDKDKMESTVTDVFIAKILATYPDINPYWLLLGQGEMLTTTQPARSENLLTGQSAEATAYYNMYKEKEAKADALLAENATLRERLRVQEEKMVGLQIQIAKFDSDNEAARDVGVAAVG